MERIKNLLKLDSKRISLLEAVRDISLPDCYIAAGFIRNLVWDHLHGDIHTPLNDVDIIYFDETVSDKYFDSKIENQLVQQMPNVNWQIRNQARMHLKNNDTPYLNTKYAMCYWPEKETAVAARITESDDIEILAPFGVDSLFAGYITHNPNRSLDIFNKRIVGKNWLRIWPKLTIVY